MKPTEYIYHWSKLHDVTLKTEDSTIVPYVCVRFNDWSINISPHDTKEEMQSMLYDLVYGTREPVPDTKRF